MSNFHPEILQLLGMRYGFRKFLQKYVILLTYDFRTEK